MGYTARAGTALQLTDDGIDYGKTLRGAIAGALAAGVWAAQIPLDKRAFGSDFDDVALLGKAITRGEAWPARRLGAAPAERSAVRRRLRQPRAAHAAALVGARPRGGERGEPPHLAAHGLTDRLHPARKELPALLANPRAFGQSTWRHLLFGVLLGEIERRLNAQEPVAPRPLPRPTASSNGHGTLAYAMPVG